MWGTDDNYLDSSQVCISMSHATGYDSSPERLRHLRNLGILNLCFRLKLKHKVRAGSNNACTVGMHPALIWQDNSVNISEGMPGYISSSLADKNRVCWLCSFEFSSCKFVDSLISWSRNTGNRTFFVCHCLWCSKINLYPTTFSVIHWKSCENVFTVETNSIHSRWPFLFIMSQ